MFLLLLAIPLLVIALSVPLIFRLVPRNFFYGIRTRSSLSGSTADWYAINRAGGTALVVGALASMLLTVAMRELGPFGRLQIGILASALPVLLLISLGVALYRQQRSAKDLNP